MPNYKMCEMNGKNNNSFLCSSFSKLALIICNRRGERYEMATSLFCFEIISVPFSVHSENAVKMNKGICRNLDLIRIRLGK